MKINPDDVDAHIWPANYYWLKGNYPAAHALLKRLMDRLPLFFPARMNYADILRQQGDIGGAIRELEKVLEQDPQVIYGQLYLALTYEDAGELAKARQAPQRLRPSDRQSYQTRLMWARQLALEGKRQDALKEMDGDVLKYAEFVNFTLMAAEVYAVLGDTVKALEWLDRAVRVGDERAEWFQRDPLLANVRNHPRFKQIIESIASRRKLRAGR